MDAKELVRGYTSVGRFLFVHRRGLDTIVRYPIEWFE